MLLMFFSVAVVRRLPVQNVRLSGTQTWASSLISAALGWNAEVHSRARWGAEARMAHAYTQVMAAAGELWKSDWRAHSVLFQCLDYTFQKACKQEGKNLVFYVQQWQCTCLICLITNTFSEQLQCLVGDALAWDPIEPQRSAARSRSHLWLGVFCCSDTDPGSEVVCFCVGWWSYLGTSCFTLQIWLI